MRETVREIEVLVVDDEPLARGKIKRFLGERTETFKVREAGDGLETLDLLRESSPAILFLDVEMPELSGFETLAQIEQRPFQVIFQTAFDEFAVRAFEENACDYLLKPFDRTRFNKALDRAIALQNATQKTNDITATNESRAVKSLEKQWLDANTGLSRIIARNGTRTWLIPIADILAFVSKDHYTHVITVQGDERICDLSLSHLQERLNPKKFQRLHRSHIVSVQAIRAVHGGDNMEVELSNGLRCPVSRANRDVLKNLLRSAQ